MQTLRFALRNLWRDLKSGELSVLLLDLCVESLRDAAPAARALQVKIAAHLPQGASTDACDRVLEPLVLESPAERAGAGVKSETNSANCSKPVVWRAI